MARCMRHIVDTVCQGISAKCARKMTTYSTNNYFSFFGHTSSRLSRTILVNNHVPSPAKNYFGLANCHNSASLHTLCKKNFTANHKLLPNIFGHSTDDGDQKSLLMTVKKHKVPVRNGTGSRGSMPHPTGNIPIAVIGPNCQLDTKQAGWANELLITLDPGMRHQLLEALREYEAMVSCGEDAEVKRLTPKELRQLAFFCGLPFIGFGTLDNLIMITAGEYIDTTFGAMLGISTMAAAAIGNMVSDVVGLGTAGYVENLARKVGVHPPKMSPTQLDMTSTKLTSNMGRVIGVLIGCTIGMTPLFF